MTAADDRPHALDADDYPDAGPPYQPATPAAEAAYLRLLSEIDLSEDEPSVPAEAVRAWVESWGTTNELPTPAPE